MNKGALCLLGILLSVALGYATAWSADPVDSLRCSSKLVRLGDTKYEVLTKCGQPVWREEVGSDYRRKGNRIKEKIDEEWIYDMGPTDFMYTLRFSGGQLKAILRGQRRGQ